MTSAPPIQVRDLVKRYGGPDAAPAVAGVSFDVGAGECVGLLGPNGAGKTTTVRMITCFTPITSGSARVFGLDVTEHPREVKARIGVCSQEDNLDPDFTVRKNLLVFARYFDLPRAEAARRADELLAFVQLSEKANAGIGELSGGMKRRLVLARTLLNRPGLLVLDEPTTGLDPQARQLIWSRVRALRAEGASVLLTTHYMEEAAQLCDRVILIDGGKVLLEGSPASLIASEVGETVVELWNLSSGLEAFLAASGWHVERADDRAYVHDRSGTAAEEIQRRFPAQERLIRHASLEDVFLKCAGRALRE